MYPFRQSAHFLAFGESENQDEETTLLSLERPSRGGHQPDWRETIRQGRVATVSPACARIATVIPRRVPAVHLFLRGRMS